MTVQAPIKRQYVTLPGYTAPNLTFAIDAIDVVSDTSDLNQADVYVRGGNDDSCFRVRLSRADVMKRIQAANTASGLASTCTRTSRSASALNLLW